METIALAEVAAVLADPSRATMCLVLLDGRAWTVGELAKAAGIALSTASEHVTRLAGAGFVVRVKQGRASYVRIADPRVAELIEHLAQHAVTSGAPPRVTGLTSSLRARRLGFARTCYDHLAGELGVALRDGMLAAGLVDAAGGLALTSRGREVLARLGVPVAAGRRPLLRDCLDWTERRDHLAGALPAALLDRAVDAGWVARGGHRAVRVLPAAGEPFAALGVDLDALSGVAAP
ncbi:metalloregulator ArsR/SmtB family transcription factor [Amycolatopsis sp. A133]|uniref:ArsR/SmtB family transcription factor n=1 Tax=Amycolatopsis sp. A133 TaxID=3064472 RepID=UPI0027FD0F97|nr:metalloregulator ArsR/SmtB family transcription factor [Amycolatopsis sp. A133]MDQ7804685.1 metalloregulator ArsR/SmtB family transcription factor [Amycolatopsis sp. A133]